MSHTPGPWKYFHEAYGRDQFEMWVVEDVAGRCPALATVDIEDENVIPTVPSEEIEANARLIAAAPDLLDICERLVGSAEYWGHYDVPLGIVDDLKAAIAKARGEA